MVKSIKLLGIDAAFANTGLVIADYDIHTGAVSIEAMHLVQTEADKVNKKIVRKNSDDLRRAGEILTTFDKVIDQYQPSMGIVEVPTGTQSARSAWSLGIAVGCIAHAGRRIPLIQVTPKEVKDITGEKHPDKEQMIAWAFKRFPNAGWPTRGGKVVAGKAEHLADAVAAIHAGIATEEFKRSIAMFRVLRGVSESDHSSA